MAADMRPGKNNKLSAFQHHKIIRQYEIRESFGSPLTDVLGNSHKFALHESQRYIYVCAYRLNLIPGKDEGPSISSRISSRYLEIYWIPSGMNLMTETVTSSLQINLINGGGDQSKSDFLITPL